MNDDSEFEEARMLAVSLLVAGASDVLPVVKALSEQLFKIGDRTSGTHIRARFQSAEDAGSLDANIDAILDVVRLVSSEMSDLWGCLDVCHVNILMQSGGVGTLLQAAISQGPMQRLVELKVSLNIMALGPSRSNSRA